MDQTIWELIMSHYRENLGICSVVTPEVARMYEEVTFEDLNRRLEDKFLNGFRLKSLVPRPGHLSLDRNGHGHQMITLDQLGYEIIDGRYVIRVSEQ